MILSGLKQVVVTSILAGVVGWVLPAWAGGSNVAVHAKLTDSSTNVPDFQNCDPVTFLPPDGGACIGIQTTFGTGSGTIEGSYVSEIDFAVLANGESQFTDYTRYAASVSGHGSGSFTVFEVATLDANGEIEGNWQIVKGSATGDLAGMRGKGKLTGSYDPNTALGVVSYTGVLHFSK